MCQLQQGWNKSQISVGRLKQPCHKPHQSGTTLNKSLSAANHVSVRSSTALERFGSLNRKWLQTSRVNYYPQGILSWTSLFLMDGLFHCLCYVEDSCRVQSPISWREGENERGAGGDTLTYKKISVIKLIFKQPLRFGVNYHFYVIGMYN